THWDHIQGWPFFVPGFIPGNTIHLYSCHTHTRERFVRQQQSDFFPVTFDEMRSTRIFHEYTAGESFQVGSFAIDTAALTHPGGSTAYRIRAGGKTFIFATDTEIFGPTLEEDMRSWKPFFEGADLVVLDAQYSLKESEQKVGWGHTAMLIAVDCAVLWNVKKALLTHHEPAHADQGIRDLFAEAVAHIKKKGSVSTAIELAMEDKIYEV
ncbi:MAG: MBL fold metallo-hydrolase, partial [Spirochaetia bacterium]|nr:MBL fold metallo-hydrolase [Spirochaetia bacterium]